MHENVADCEESPVIGDCAATGADVTEANPASVAQSARTVVDSLPGVMSPVIAAVVSVMAVAVGVTSTGGTTPAGSVVKLRVAPQPLPATLSAHTRS